MRAQGECCDPMSITETWLAGAQSGQREERLRRAEWQRVERVRPLKSGEEAVPKGSRGQRGQPPPRGQVP